MDKTLQEDLGHMAIRHKNLVDEAVTLKAAFDAILSIRSGLRIYEGCQEVIGSTEETISVIRKRIDQIEIEMKRIADLARKQGMLIKEPREGSVQ